MRWWPILFLVACNADDTGDDDTGDGGGGGGSDDPVTFVEHFADDSNVDSSDIPLDTSSTGWAVADSWDFIGAMDEDVGDGSDGAFFADADQVLSAGEYQFTSFEIAPDVRVDVDGDVVFRVDGPVTFDTDAQLEGAGTIKFVVSGAVDSDCGIAQATGAYTLHQPTAAGILLHCSWLPGGAQMWASQRSDEVDPHFQMWTRGGIRLENESQLWVWADDATTEMKAGDMDVRAYGDITINGRSYITVDFTLPWEAGDVRVWTEGNLTLSSTSHITSGGGTLPGGGHIDIRVGGDFQTSGGGSVLAEEGGTITINADGDVAVEDGTTVMATGRLGVPSDVTIRSRNLRVTNDGYIGCIDGLDTKGGTLLLEASENILFDSGGGANSGDSSGCKDGPPAILRAAGDVTIGAEVWLSAGRADTDVACTDPLDGGNVEIDAGGTITIDDPSFVSPGNGNETGSQGVYVPNPGAAVDVTPDSGLRPPFEVTSIGLSMEGATGEVLSAEHYDVEGLDPLVELWLSPDGSEEGFVPWSDLVGGELQQGWKYRVVVRGHMFDGGRLDGFEVTYR